MLISILFINAIKNIYDIKTREYFFSSKLISQDYTFVHISDYHSAQKEDEKILKITRKNQPDYILLSGDILSAINMNPTLSFIQKLREITLVIYAIGNHNNDFSTYKIFCHELRRLGVIVLNSKSYSFKELNFIRIEDQSNSQISNSNFKDNYIQFIEKHQALIQEEKYNILLAHHPNFLESYSKLKANLILSGHAHGGQWQIPFTKIGILAPDEGYFPRHVKGS